MNKIFCVFLFSIVNVFSITSGQDLWKKQISPTSKNLNKLVFTDSITGWAVGDSGAILHTTNGGENWLIQQSGIDANIHSVTFPTPYSGRALAWKSDAPPYGTYILRTSDGGITWENEFFREENVFLQPVYFIDSLTGWVGAGSAGLYYTTDGGREWISSEIDSFGGFPKKDFAFLNKEYGYVCGGTFDVVGLIWRTSDGGRTWHGKPTGPEPVHKLHLRDSLLVEGIGGDFEYGVSVVRTTDAGMQWSYTELNIFGIGLGLAFRTPAEGWVSMNGGLTGKFLLTNDSGYTWVESPTPDSVYLADVVFPDSLHGYAVGQNGIILRYNGSLAAIQHASEKKKEFLLNQNFPNPFNPATTISYELYERTFVVITIYDILGKEKETLVRAEQFPGVHQVQFDGSGLPSGVYYYTLKAGQYLSARKMVILK